MSPFSILVKELRTSCGLKQAEFAQRLGVEQSYVSAVEVGKKGPPGADFMAKLVQAFDLDNAWECRLQEALELSQRRFELPKGTSTEAYRIFNRLRTQLHDLHPAQIELIEYALKLPDVIKRHESNLRVARAAAGKVEDELQQE
jgi:transcriptional regulator with XRE-family HTH domain